MALNSVDIAIPVIVIIITALLSAINYSIYTKTKKGSYAFKCWAIAALSYLSGSLFYLAVYVITQDSVNLVAGLVDHVLFGIYAGFFVLLGVIFMGIDTKVFGYSKEEIKSFQLPFLVLVLITFLFIIVSGYTNLVPGETISFISIASGSLVQSLLWCISAIMFFPVYIALRKGTRAWIIIYLSLLSMAAVSISETLFLFGYVFFEYVYVTAGVLFTIFLLSGFFLLNRSIKG